MEGDQVDHQPSSQLHTHSSPLPVFSLVPLPCFCPRPYPGADSKGRPLINMPRIRLHLRDWSPANATHNTHPGVVTFSCAFQQCSSLSRPRGTSFLDGWTIPPQGSAICIILLPKISPILVQGRTKPSRTRGNLPLVEAGIPLEPPFLA